MRLSNDVMSDRRMRIAIILLTLFLTSCVSNRGQGKLSYEDVAARLDRPNGCNFSCYGVWYPSNSQDPPGSQITTDKAKDELIECVSRFKQEATNRDVSLVPPESVKTGLVREEAVGAEQLKTCMRDKGWSYVIVEIVV